MKFDFVIGNPPYQEEMEATSDKPVYNYFMDAVYEIADKVELITPARFLFNAGKTPKAWNEKMLADEHFKILYYESESVKIFPNTDIKGGIAISYYDKTKKFKPINNFITNDILRSILDKILNMPFSSFSDIIFAPESYKLSKRLHNDYPEIALKLSKGHMFDLTTNIAMKLSDIFFDKMPKDGNKYIQILLRENNKRIRKYIRRDYIAQHPNLDCYKVFFTKSNSSGTFGEELAVSEIGSPGIGHNQTFISIGAFKTKDEAESCRKYVTSKFARALLGTLKVTQDNKKSVWKNVPLQDFTSNSDIDWSKSIPEIDQQLYKKYGLDEKEIEFIETHVKEMK